MGQSLESNSVEKFKAIAAIADILPIFQVLFFFKKKEKDFSKNLVNLDMGI